MKRITLLLATVIISTLSLWAEEVVLCDVETVKSEYTIGSTAAFEVIANPLKDGVNSTDSVIQLARTGFAASNWWVLINIPVATFTTITGENYIDIAVKYPAQPDIALRLNKDANYQFRPIQKYTNIGGWEVLRFNISSVSAGYDVSILQFLYDVGNENTPSGYVLNNTDAFGYIDQIKYINSAITIPETIEMTVSDFESEEPHGWVTNFGAAISRVENPDKGASSINATNYCLELGDAKTTSYALIDYTSNIFIPNSDCYLHVMAKSIASPNIALRTMPDNSINILPIDSLVPNNQWQDLVFNIKEYKSAGYAISALRLMLDNNENNLNTTDSLLYIDEIIINSSPTPRTTEVTQLAEASVAVAMYPNPVSDVLYLGNPAVQQVVLFNMAGQQVLTQAIVNAQINVSALPQGIYYVQCKDDMGKVLSNQSLIKK